MRQIIMAVIQLRPDLYALAKNSKERGDTDYNIEGTMVTNMCSLKNKAIMTAFVYLTEQGVVIDIIGVWRTDGLPGRRAA